MKILGITGKKGSGKSLIAETIQLHYPRTVIINFADALKDEVAKACGIDTVFIEKNKPVFRPILQWWGTDFRRHFKGDNYWIEKWINKVMTLPLDVQLVIVADVRFHNEAEALKKWTDTQLWRVIRPSIISDDTHPSEIQMDSYSCDVRILNNGTKQELVEGIKQQIEKRIK